MPDLADALIDDILRDAPGHVPGTRPIHAPGVCAAGRFRGDPIAPRYTMAEHLAGQWVPVTVRFSDGTGLPAAPAQPPSVRGMAVKFHLDGGRETDLIAMSIPVFFARTVPEFESFAAAAEPVPVRRRPLWHRVADQLALRTPAPQPAPGTLSGAPGVFSFANAHPVAGPAVAAAGTQISPASYTTLAYHAVHAFRLTTATGASCWARLDWEPVAGVVGGAPAADLRQALADEISARRAQFVLRGQIGDAGDDVADPTHPWPRRRRRVVLGQLWLDRVIDDDPDAGCEALSFNPARLVTGIEGHPDDEIFRIRGEVYARSYERRIAERRPTA